MYLHVVRYPYLKWTYVCNRKYYSLGSNVAYKAKKCDVLCNTCDNKYSTHNVQECEESIMWVWENCAKIVFGWRWVETNVI